MVNMDKHFPIFQESERFLTPKYFRATDMWHLCVVSDSHYFLVWSLFSHL